MKVKFLLYLLGITLSTACQYESEESLFPNENCQAETQVISYSIDIQMILTNYQCVSCHNSGLASGGIRLESYSDVRKVSESNQLNGVITHAAGFPAMPLSGNKLTDCDIQKVQKWIADGMPE